MAHNDAQPVVSTDNPDSLDALQQWLEGMRDRQQRPGKEPNQEPVQLVPIPPYEYPSVPGERSTPGTPLPVQLVRDPEPVTDDEFSRRREKVPVSHSPTRTRTRPFLPARREPEHSPAPLQPVAEIIQREPVPVVQLPPQEPFTEPTPIRKRVTRLPEPDRAPQKFNPNLNPVEFSDEFLKPKGEVDPEPKGEQKPEVKPRSKPEQSVQPTTPLQPKFTTKFYGKHNKAGRQRGKDRNDSGDGVRQLFELWWSKAGRGVSFQHFYRNHLSKSMRFYYPREYINNGANPKSAAEYRQWRKEWTAKQAVKTA